MKPSGKVLPSMRKSRRVSITLMDSISEKDDRIRSIPFAFLHDLQVPTNNNLSERKLRNFKRKQKQMISFRSDASLAYTCDGMRTIDRIRSDPEKNLFQEVTKIFER